MKKGFTIIEMIAAMILISLAAAFMLSVYNFSYGRIADSRTNISTSYVGQEDIENLVTKTIGDADRYAQFRSKNPASTPVPEGIVEPEKAATKLWGSSIDGYSLAHEIKRKEGVGARAEVFAFVYANLRDPLKPSMIIQSTANNLLIPKFQYLESISRIEGKFTVSVVNPEVLRRAMRKSYLTSFCKEVGSENYVFRPYTDFLSMETLENSPIYNSNFPSGFIMVPEEKESIAIDQNPNQTTNLVLEYDAEIREKYKEQFRDKAHILTIQGQAINGYVAEEQVVNDTSTWFIGTPVISNLVGHWDANLTFLKNSTDNNDSTKNNLESYKENVPLGAEHPWNSVLELAKRTSFITMDYINQPKLLVKRDEGTSQYRQHSAGVNLHQTGRLVLGGFKKDKDYSVIIRAKQINSEMAPLFTVNMDNNKNIRHNALTGNYFANGVFISNAGGLPTISYESILSQNGEQRRRLDPSGVFHSSLYDFKTMSLLDDRKDYHIYELSIGSQNNDIYNVSVIIDGAKKYQISQYDVIRLSDYGLEIGSNLEVSDIVVYEDNLSGDESKTMANYLLKKYLTTEDEVKALSDNIVKLG